MKSRPTGLRAGGSAGQIIQLQPAFFSAGYAFQQGGQFVAEGLQFSVIATGGKGHLVLQPLTLIFPSRQILLDGGQFPRFSKTAAPGQGWGGPSLGRRGARIRTSP